MQNINQRLCIYEKKKSEKDAIMFFMEIYISDLYMEMNISLFYEL